MSEADQHVTFRVNNSLYALSVAYVEEIVIPQRITPIPLATPILLGVMKNREGVLYVYSFRRFFNLPEINHTLETRVLLSSIFGKQVGFLVDEVISIEEFSNDTVTPSPSIREGVASLLSGFIHDSKSSEILAVVDLPKFGL